MRIILSNFRCYDYKEFDIPDRKLTLIKGPSGIGKSTIFQAITWCLYGNIRCITPNTIDTQKGKKPKIKTSVTLELENQIITRQKHPGLLSLFCDNTEYQDKTAQELINQTFGDYELWSSVSYINQGTRNSFLTASNSVKMELLNKLAFNTEDPRQYIMKIDTAISADKKKYQEVNDELNGKINEFKEYTQDKTITNESISLIPNLSKYNEQIIEIKKSLQEIQNIEKNREKILSIMNTLEKNIQHIQTQIAQIPILNHPFPKNENVELAINQYQTKFSFLSKLHQLQTNLNTVDNRITEYRDLPYIKCDENDLLTTQINEKLYKENYQKAQSLHIEYTKERIEAELIGRQNYIDGQRLLHITNEIKHCEGKLLELQNRKKNDSEKPVFNLEGECRTENKPIPPNIDHIENQKKEIDKNINQINIMMRESYDIINQYEQYHNSLFCPNCNKPLHYVNGKITISNICPISKEIYDQNIQIRNEWQTKLNELQLKVKDLIVTEKMENDRYQKEMHIEHQKHVQYQSALSAYNLHLQKQQLEYQQIQELETHISRLKTISANSEFLPGSPSHYRILSSSELEQMTREINILRSINIIEPIRTSSQCLQKIIARNKLITQREELLKDIAEITEKNENLGEYAKNIEEEMKRIKQMILEGEQYLNQQKILDIQKNTLITNLTRLQNDFEQEHNRLPPSNMEKINHLENEILQLTRNIEDGNIALQASNLHNSMVLKNNETMAVYQHMGYLQKFRQHAVDVECLTLQNLVDSINYSIGEIVETLFDKPINVVLQLHKTLKTTQYIKPTINFTINYAGGQFDNINQMSGGEGDRLSLSLTMALNKLSGCPFLMLDESLSSLDNDFKEISLHTMKEILSDKTIICIMHDGVEGYYDNIITLGD